MPQAVISGTGLYQPPHIVTNEELVVAFNAYAEAQNAVNGLPADWIYFAIRANPSAKGSIRSNRTRSIS